MPASGAASPSTCRCTAAARWPTEQDLSLAALAAGLEDFCDALGLTGIDLVANDTGGAIAQIFAARNPHRLATFTLTNCDTSGNMPPEAFKPVVELAAAGQLAPTAVAMLADLDGAAQLGLRLWLRAPGPGRPGGHPLLPGAVVRHPRARPALRAAADRSRRRRPDRGHAAPGGADRAHPGGVGHRGRVFDVSWAYWLRDTIPGTTRVVTVDGARLFFPEERPMDLVPHLEQHWAAAAAVRA